MSRPLSAKVLQNANWRPDCEPPVISSETLEKYAMSLAMSLGRRISKMIVFAVFSKITANEFGDQFR